MNPIAVIGLTILISMIVFSTIGCVVPTKAERAIETSRSETSTDQSRVG